MNLIAFSTMIMNLNIKESLVPLKKMLKCAGAIYAYLLHRYGKIIHVCVSIICFHAAILLKFWGKQIRITCLQNQNWY